MAHSFDSKASLGPLDFLNRGLSMRVSLDEHRGRHIAQDYLTCKTQVKWVIRKTSTYALSRAVAFSPEPPQGPPCICQCVRSPNQKVEKEE